MNEGSTHFGFREVASAHKADKVGEVFTSVAGRYDLMNDLMSLGSHRLWKDFAVARSGVRAGHHVLDVAAGSGDMTRRFAKYVGVSGRVVMTVINQSMLECGRARLLDQGIGPNIDLLLADAETLPFTPHRYDCVSIAFGLRKALLLMTCMRKPVGRVLILLFLNPTSDLLSRAYDLFSFSVIPPLGRLVTGDEPSYRYLVESIRRHPNQDTLREMMADAGLEDVEYHNLSGGIVAVHTGFRY